MTNTEMLAGTEADRTGADNDNDARIELPGKTDHVNAISQGFSEARRNGRQGLGPGYETLFGNAHVLGETARSVHPEQLPARAEVRIATRAAHTLAAAKQ